MQHFLNAFFDAPYLYIKVISLTIISKHFEVISTTGLPSDTDYSPYPVIFS